MDNRPICSKCGSSNVYVKIKTQELVCRRCGNVLPLQNSNREVK
jgi:transcription initiation factor TFIIIB Brf1 subunit/transcription initiation factor TFIIB